MNNFNVHVLFDPGATHSFIARRIVTKLRKGVEVVEKGFVILTPMGNMVETNIVYVGVGVRPLFFLRFKRAFEKN